MHHKTKVKTKQKPPIIIAHLTPLNENGGLDLIPKLCKSIFVSFSQALPKANLNYLSLMHL